MRHLIYFVRKQIHLIFRKKEFYCNSPINNADCVADPQIGITTANFFLFINFLVKFLNIISCEVTILGDIKDDRSCVVFYLKITIAEFNNRKDCAESLICNS